MDPEPSVDMSYMIYLHTVFRIRVQLNPDPAKNLNPDPEDP